MRGFFPFGFAQGWDDGRVEVQAVEEDKEMAMKTMQWLATVLFVVAGIALLCAPGRAAGMGVGAYSPTRFTVTDAGTPGKPDVLLVPGLASSKSVWDAEVVLLTPNYRLHLVQVDGFAGAPAGANATASAAAGDNKAGEMLPGIVEELHGYIVAAKMHPVVVGHSLGGLLALMLADRHPEDVRKMVIVDALPFYAVLFNPAATVEAMQPMAEGIKQQMIGVPADQYAAMQEPMMAAMVKDPEGLKAVVASSLASDRGVVAEAMYEDLTTDMRREVGTIKTPALVMYEYDGTSKVPDPAVYEATVKAGYHAMANVKLVRVDGSRHFIMYDQPAKFDAALEEFLR
jgi:pimeloyl-ACP methyl ester carboxylesterase